MKALMAYFGAVLLIGLLLWIACCVNVSKQ